MKLAALAVIAFAFCFVSAPARSQSAADPASNSAASAARAQASPMQAELNHAGVLMAGKYYEQAARAYATLTREHPRNAIVWDLMGVALQQSGDTDSARAAYQHATKVNSRYSEAYNNIGTTWYEEQRYGKAIRAYQKALAVDPNLAIAYSNMGYAYFAEKKIPEALDAFNKALTLDPDVFNGSSAAGTILQDRSVSDHGALYFLLAKSYAERNDPADCAEYLRKAFDEGYQGALAVQTDPAFAKVIADPGVQAILEREAVVEARKAPSAPAK